MVVCILLASLFVTLGLAVYFAVPAGRWGRRPVRARVLLRALLPPRMLRTASGRLDIWAMLFSLFLATVTMSWALYSSAYFAASGRTALVNLFGHPRPTILPAWLCSAVTTLALYLAYEFAYWLNHYLSHRWRILWEFHKVHHSAESLSVLTNFRVHPVDTIVFYNMVAVAGGFSTAALDFLFGRQTDAITIGGTNLLIFLTSMMLTHLQHSQLWISLPGRWGRWLLSPAHHQIHHSIDARHHNTNFGNTLAAFDHLFGTLCLPAKRRERLVFGVDGIAYDPHSVRGAMLMPFVDAALHVRERMRRPRGRLFEGVRSSATARV